MSDPEFLDLEDVLLIHEQQLTRYGGSGGIRDQGILQSALGTPRATFGSRQAARAAVLRVSGHSVPNLHPERSFSTDRQDRPRSRKRGG